MDSIVRSCKILVPHLQAGRLILDGYYDVIFVLLIFFSNKKKDHYRLWWQDSVFEMFQASPLLFNVLSLYILECSGVCGIFFAYSSTAKHNRPCHMVIHCLFH